MTLPDKHLDLGCGKFPRNPYARTRLCGVDIRAPDSDRTGSNHVGGNHDVEYRIANLVLHPIPYDDDSFGSVSAYDFIEHVPRVMSTMDGQDTRFPFVELMQQIWRVLAPGGRLYALTPAWPYAAAFGDPTHVNIVTLHTHEYFCGEAPMARMYGFQGKFKALRVHWTHAADAYSAIQGSPENRKPRTGLKKTASRLRGWSRRLRGVDAQEMDGTVYLLWELEAIKSASEQ